MSDSICHCTAIRLRATGTGNLQASLRSLDDVRTSALTQIPLAAANRVLPIRLANFEEQYMQLELATTVIDEVVTINKIAIFLKPVANEYPG